MVNKMSGRQGHDPYFDSMIGKIVDEYQDCVRIDEGIPDGLRKQINFIAKRYSIPFNDVIDCLESEITKNQDNKREDLQVFTDTFDEYGELK